MTRLFLIFHGRFPSEKAASLFAARSAEAFVREGIEVVLLVPKRKMETIDPRAFYGLKEIFPIIYLGTVDLFGFPIPKPITFWIGYLTFSWECKKYIRTHATKSDSIYSNELIPLWLVAPEFKNTFYEMHDFPESKHHIFKILLRRMRWVLIHNRWKTAEAVRLFGINKAKLMTEPNAVDLHAFNSPLSRAEARKKLNLPMDIQIVGYTGHLYSWKGVDTLAAAAKLLPNLFFVFVGGTPEDYKKYQLHFTATNIQWVGFRPPNEIPLWQRAADVLVLPNTAKQAISAYYTSPMKLFEYMASGTPVIASRIPSVEEIVSDESVTYFEPDSVDSLVVAIQTALTDETTSAQKAKRAQEEIQSHTWDKRAGRIIAFMRSS